MFFDETDSGCIYYLCDLHWLLTYKALCAPKELNELFTPQVPFLIGLNIDNVR